MNELETYILRAFSVFGFLFALAAFFYLLLGNFQEFISCVVYAAVSFLLWKTLRQ